MSQVVGSQTSWTAGLGNSKKSGPKYSFAPGSRSIDFRTDPRAVTILPRAKKISGSVVTDLPMCADRIDTDDWILGNTGKIYKKTSGGTWSLEHTAPNCSGNGLGYFGEDDFLYYAQDTTIGRYGPISTSPQWYDDFLGSEGGDPTNTNSITLNGTSQYLYRADTASLSFTGDFTLEIEANPTSLPETGDTMTLVGKWDESGTTQSYLMDITTASDFFGDGSDGALTISTNTTEAPIDSTCSGTSGTKALTATNASFAAGQKIMIHQTRGTNAGTTQYTEIEAYTAGTITTVDNLDISFSSTGSSKAQVRVLKQYTDVTINAGITYTAKAWDGTVGGIIGFYANGTVAVNGTITATGKGYLGASASATDSNGKQGEGTSGARDTVSTAANGNAGGGGTKGYDRGAAGGSGGHATAGNNGNTGEATPLVTVAGTGGALAGTADLTTMVFGGGGGSGGGWHGGAGGAGGNGGGVVIINGATTTLGAGGSIITLGNSGASASGGGGAGAPGAAGAVLINTQEGTLGTDLISATSTAGTDLPSDLADSNASSVGRIHLNYYSSYTGTTSPTLDATQDDLLAAGDGYVLRLRISDDGDAVENLIWDITENISTGSWGRWSIAFDSSAATAYFYKDGSLLGSKTGTMTEIDDNAGEFFIGANKDSGGDAANFFDGKLDDARVWNDIRTVDELSSKDNVVMYGTEAGMIAYYKFDGDVTDSQTDGLNDLTAVDTPTYTQDVPFSGYTARADEDQVLETSGQTYTLTTAISEADTHRQTFVPAKDPQKSVEINFDGVSTGNVTVTVHDALNRTIASKTIAAAELHTDDSEFVFDSVWRPTIGAEYHFHVTSTVADGTLVTTDSEDLETADFHTHYQFLVDDDYHSIVQFTNNLFIGNERYIARWRGLTASDYDPHLLELGSGERVRCFAFWREYLAIGVWKGSSITDRATGRIYFWDGTSDSYDYFIDIPEGGINAMLGTPGALHIWAGWSGDHLIYPGDEEGKATKVKRIPLIEKDEYVEIAPNAVAMWQSLIHYGAAINSDSTNIDRGVYSWDNFAEGFDYPLSLGPQTNTNVKVGLLYVTGQSLLVGWQNSNTFGVDEIAVTNNPQSSAICELLITDLNDLPREKLPLTARADFDYLNTDESIQLKYKVNRENNWNEGDTEDTEDARNTRMRIPKEANEIQVGVNLATDTTTSPTLLGISLEADDSRQQKPL